MFRATVGCSAGKLLERSPDDAASPIHPSVFLVRGHRGRRGISSGATAPHQDSSKLRHPVRKHPQEPRQHHDKPPTAVLARGRNHGTAVLGSNYSRRRPSVHCATGLCRAAHARSTRPLTSAPNLGSAACRQTRRGTRYRIAKPIVDKGGADLRHQPKTDQVLNHQQLIARHHQPALRYPAFCRRSNFPPNS